MFNNYRKYFWIGKISYMVCNLIAICDECNGNFSYCKCDSGFVVRKVYYVCG